MEEELATLIDRRDWLGARIAAKRSIGWETHYDEREHAALCWAIDQLSREGQQKEAMA